MPNVWKKDRIVTGCGGGGIGRAQPLFAREARSS